MIPQDLIDKCLRQLLDNPSPGDTLHTMVVVTEDPAERARLGFIDPDKLDVDVWMLNPCRAMSPDQLFSDTAKRIVVQTILEKRLLHFAGLGVVGEMLATPIPEGVNADDVPPVDPRGHPDAVQAVVLLAACRDGRRWSGWRFLDGPQAGKQAGPELHATKRLASPERVSVAKIVRSMVGLRR